MGEGSLINLERAPGGGISVESSGYDVANIPFLGPYSFRSPDIVVSSNLVHWTPATLNDLPDMPAGPRLFVRGVNRVWPCTEQKRSLQWAKEQWAVDNFQPFIAEPEDTDLFGPNLYLPAKPQCPSAGTYNILSISESPTCTIDGHLLW